jgi:O-antigen/teichoic acid export membrane protein
MTDPAGSYRRILKSSSLIGGASVINIAVGILRTKALAVLLGPVGVGITSLYTGLISTATMFGTLGVGTVGTRQIAEANSSQDNHSIAVARRALFLGTAILAIAAGIVVWSLRGILAERIFADPSQSGAVAWLSLGVALSVASASQGALIQGMQRIRDLASLSVFSSVLNTVMGVALLWKWRAAGLIAYVLVGPIVNFALGHFYVSKIKLNKSAVSNDEIVTQWRRLLSLGFAFVAAELVGSLIQLWIRVYVGKELGTSALGHYQAAWTISTQYVGFVLGAMAMDYYPRLTGLIRDKEAAVRLVNEQTEIAMLLSAPIFIAMMALAPQVVRLLYSASFSPAVEVLRWQILGDVLKIASWPLGFVILAAGDGKSFFWTETVTWLLAVAFVIFLLPTFGLNTTGLAWVVVYACYLPLVYTLAKSRIGFRWSRMSVQSFLISFVACASVQALSAAKYWGPISSFIAIVATASWAPIRIRSISRGRETH